MLNNDSAAIFNCNFLIEILLLSEYFGVIILLLKPASSETSLIFYVVNISSNFFIHKVN